MSRNSFMLALEGEIYYKTMTTNITAIWSMKYSDCIWNRQAETEVAFLSLGDHIVFLFYASISFDSHFNFLPNCLPSLTRPVIFF